MKSVFSLLENVKRLPKKKRELFFRMYSVVEDYARLKIPKDMKPWTIKNFGSLKKAEKQKIVRIDNNITCDSALYNEVRGNRPYDTNKDSELDKTIKSKEGGPFCKPLKMTPEDIFGRVKGKFSTSASNIAKYEAYHGLVIFKEHNPLKFTKASIKDHLETSVKWINKVYKQDKSRVYPFIMWNCLWKASSSIIHGHMQVTVGKDKPYGEIERLRRFASGYRNIYGTNFYEDIFQIHKSLGLTVEAKNYKLLAPLTARKEKEVIILSDKFESLHEAIFKVTQAYKKMGVQSFNMGIYMKPLNNKYETPYIVRLVDRGKLTNQSSDIGGMEMFAGSSVIETDPYKVIEEIKK